MNLSAWAIQATKVTRIGGAVVVLVMALAAVWLGVHRQGDTDTHALAYRAGEPAAWNQISVPAADDLNQSVSHFISWWSPGHVLLPMGLERIGFSPVRARAVLNVGSLFLGLWGLWALASAAGFSREVAWWACLGVALAPVVGHWTLYYGGGDVLGFALTPWALRGMIRWLNSPVKTVLGILLFGALGFFCKSSLLLLPIAWSGVAALVWISAWLRRPVAAGAKFPIRNCVSVVVAVAAVLVVTRFGYLAKGDTPTGAVFAGDAMDVVAFTPNRVWDLIYPWAGPGLALIPLEWLERVFPVAGRNLGIGMSALLGIWVVGYARRRCSHEYFILLVTMVVGYAGFFTMLYLRDASVSWAPRHFTPVLFPIALVLAHGLLAARRGLRVIGLLFLLLSWGMQTAVWGYHRFVVWHQHTVVRAGDTLPADLLTIWQEVKRIDVAPDPDKRIFLILPWNRSLELAVERSRLIATSPGNTGMPSFRKNGTHFPGSSYEGFGPDIYIVVDDAVAVDQVAAGFKAYGEPRLVFSAEPWAIYCLKGRAGIPERSDAPH